MYFTSCLKSNSIFLCAVVGSIMARRKALYGFGPTSYFTDSEVAESLLDLASITYNCSNNLECVLVQHKSFQGFFKRPCILYVKRLLAFT